MNSGLTSPGLRTKRADRDGVDMVCDATDYYYKALKHKQVSPSCAGVV